MVSTAALIAALDSADAPQRLAAATRLGELSLPPVDAIAALVAHVADPGTVEEEYYDWTGWVCGGTTHRVADRVIDALAAIGAPAVVALLDAVDAGRTPTAALYRVAGAQPLDTLLATGRAALARLLRVATSAPVAAGDWAHANTTRAVQWALDELASGGDRFDVLARRLFLEVGFTDVNAAKELANVGDARRAARLLAETLLDVPRLSNLVQSAAATSLDQLGPILDAPLAARLVAAASTEQMFYCWPQLLPAVASYGDAAASLGPWLVAWLRDDTLARERGKGQAPEVRRAVALAIARLGDAARPLHAELAEIYVREWKMRDLVVAAFPDRRVLDELVAARG